MVCNYGNTENVRTDEAVSHVRTQPLFSENCLGFSEHKFFTYEIVRHLQKDDPIFCFFQRKEKWRKLSYKVGFPAC